MPITSIIIINVRIIISNQFNSQDSPPAANNEDENEGKSSEQPGLEEGISVEVVNQQCCAGSKACLIL